MKNGVRKASKEQVAALSTETVRSVYSGKAHKCCCGCSGIHRHNSRFPKKYEHQVDNDRQVKKVIAIIQANAERAQHFGGGISVELCEKLYCAYTEA